MTSPQIGHFTILKKCIKTNARISTLHLFHGPTSLPTFMPVATKACMKAIPTKFLHADIILSNTYHCRNLNYALSDFMSYTKPMLTDSGGFQIVSLKDSEVCEDGVYFTDKEKILLRPEDSIRIQNLLGADIIMQLDDVVNPLMDRNRIEEAMYRSLRWLGRCVDEHKNENQILFPIIQGGLHEDLRKKSIDGIIYKKSINENINEKIIDEMKKENKDENINEKIIDEMKKEKSIGKLKKENYDENINEKIIDEMKKEKSTGKLKKENYDAIINEKYLDKMRKEDKNAIVNKKSIDTNFNEKNIDEMKKENINYGINKESKDVFTKEKNINKSNKSLRGIAIGGLSGGENKDDFIRIVKFCIDNLPENIPKYVMGVGYPEDVLCIIALGADMSDCVYPTRTARFGRAFTDYGDLNLAKSEHLKTLTGIKGCKCYMCLNHSLAYVHSLKGTSNYCSLITVHNIFYMSNFIKRIRCAIEEDRFEDFVREFVGKRFGNDVPSFFKNTFRNFGIIF